tara:strand:- start:28 stop:726 length:699 start_codon:yes stop_codon:yes gene_type:complete
LPQQGKVDFLLSHDCDYELSIAAHTHNIVTAHVVHPLVYNFWQCLETDKTKVYDILLDEAFRFDKDEFTFMQETWNSWESTHAQAALFFLLTAASSVGRPSRGTLHPTNINALTFSRLKLFKKPTNLTFYYNEERLLEKISQIDTDALVIHGGDYRYNLFDYGKPHAPEEYIINHQRLHEEWSNMPSNTFLLYNYDEKLMEKYPLSDITMINKYGSPTKWRNECKEIIIAKR